MASEIKLSPDTSVSIAAPMSSEISDVLPHANIELHLAATSASVQNATADTNSPSYFIENRTLLEAGIVSGEKSTVLRCISALYRLAISEKTEHRQFVFLFVKEYESFFMDWLFHGNTAATLEIGANIEMIFETFLDRKYPDQYAFALECLRDALDQNELGGLHIINLISGLAGVRNPPEDIIKLLKTYLTKNGLDAHAALNAWYSSSTDDPSIAIHRNLKMLHELEKQQPGAAKILQTEFGIQNFGRYPIAALIAQCDAKNATDKPYGVVVYPLYDHNGSFFQGKNKFSDLYGTLNSLGYYMRITEVGSKEDVINMLNTLHARYGHDVHGGAGHKISFMVLGGHGTKDEVRLGSGWEEDRLFTSDFQDDGLMRDAMKFFVPNPTFILESCSTGQIGGIAHHISRLGAEVYAPRNATHLSEIPVLLQDGRLEFHLKYASPDAAMRYPIGGSY